MKTRHGIQYYIEDGKLTIDGYDRFDTLEELEADIDWQLLWIVGKAFREDGIWKLI